MKIILWEYKTIELPIGTTQKDTINALNKEGSEGWEVILIRDRNVKVGSSTTVRLVFLLKRPCGETTLRVLFKA